MINLLIKTDLLIKKDSLASDLSGGQKRKLCLIISFIGKSKLIILDEPTSGVDINSKRQIWSLLKEQKKDKIILLTTHSLDEAELVADNIGIMKDGNLVALGHLSNLKEKYNCGLNIFIIKNPSQTKIDYKIREDFTIIKETKNYCHLSIDKNYDSILGSINSLKEDGVINNYSISSTTLEDIFIKLNPNSVNEKKSDNQDKLKYLIHNSQSNTVLGLVCNDLFRNLQIVSRSKKYFCIEIVSSILFLLIFVLSSLFPVNNILDLKYITDNMKSDVYFISDDISSIKNCNVFQNSKFIDIKEIPSSTDNILYSIDNYLNERFSKPIKLSYYITKDKISIIYSKSNTDFQTVGLSSVVKCLNNSHNFIIEQYTMIDLGIKNPITQMNIQAILLYSLFSILTIISYSLYKPTFERLNGMKRIINLFSNTRVVFWVSTFISDYIKYLIVLVINFCLIVLMLVVTKMNYSILNVTLIMIMLLIFIFMGISLILIGYIITFLADKEERSKVYFQIYILISFLLTIPSFVNITSEELLDFVTSDSLKINYYSLSPISQFYVCLVKISYLQMSSLFISHIISIDNYWTLGKSCIYVFILLSIVSIVLIYLIERCFIIRLLKMIEKLYYKVRGERLDSSSINYNRLNESSSNSSSVYVNESLNSTINKANDEESTIRLIKCNKTYNKYSLCSKKIHAVRDIYFGLSKGEKFGLVGLNGGGKSSIFKCIIQENYFDTGDVYVFNNKTTVDNDFVSQLISYCPQSNFHTDNLTVEENIRYFIAMSNIIINDIDFILEEYGLLHFKNTYSINLSGGNKRKLCFAISLLNNKKLLLLDEPSTGVDADGRRKIISILNESNKNIILTTHSIEEAEVLCDTLGWVENGKFTKVGSVGELRLELSQGYYVSFRIKDFDINKLELESINSLIIDKVCLLDCEEDLKSRLLIILSQIHNEIGVNTTQFDIIAMDSNSICKLKINFNSENQLIVLKYFSSELKSDNKITELSISLDSLENLFLLNN